MWMYAAAAVAAVGGVKLYMKATTGWCNIENDLSGKVFIVTGATAGKKKTIQSCSTRDHRPTFAGIGKETASELAKHGATVHLACRNMALGRAVADEIRQATGNEKIKLWELDLQSMKSVRQFAKAYLESGQPIHVLINNAGVGGKRAR